MTEGLRFNLIDEPWIDVLDVNGNKSTVSIREALSASGQIRRIAGELPTQDVAIVRLLLAILYRALPVDGDDEVVRETWAHWWKDHAFPSEVVSEYLDEYRGRFELFDPATPSSRLPICAPHQARLPGSAPWSRTFRQVISSSQIGLVQVQSLCRLLKLRGGWCIAKRSIRRESRVAR